MTFNNMSAGNQITVIGNLVDDPELRFTGSGAPVVNFRVASTPRVFDRQANEWKDGNTLFVGCTVWRNTAENVAETLRRGMEVVVIGDLAQRQYETREGEKRTAYDIDVTRVAVDLNRQTADVKKVSRGGGQQAAQQAQSAPAQQAPAQQQQQQQAPQQTAPAGQPQQDPFAGPGAGFTPQPYAGAGAAGGPGF